MATDIKIYVSALIVLLFSIMLSNAMETSILIQNICKRVNCTVVFYNIEQPNGNVATNINMYVKIQIILLFYDRLYKAMDKWLLILKHRVGILIILLLYDTLYIAMKTWLSMSNSGTLCFLIISIELSIITPFEHICLELCTIKI